MSILRAPSLKVRALQWLALREHSRDELRAKLLRLRQPLGGRPSDEPELSAHNNAEIDTLLDWLVGRGYLSEQRFVESRVHARAARFGNLRIEAELRRQGVALDAQTASALIDSELGRAQALWRRKFGDQPPADAAARMRQMRFLAARGFNAEIVRRVVRAAGSAAD
jgi:regulatory protein